MRPSATLSIRLPAERAALPLIRSLVRLWLETAEVAGQAKDEVVLAAWEACANAVEHPVGATVRELDLEARVAGGGLHLTVRDRGRWRTRSRRRPYRGLGLELVCALMDDVSIRCEPGGTVVHMFRRVGETGDGREEAPRPSAEGASSAPESVFAPRAWVRES